MMFKQNKTLLTAAIVLFIAVLAFFGAYQIFAPTAADGAKAISIEVVDHNQERTSYSIRTDAEYLIDAMKETPKFTFSGYEGPYGLTLTAINGITADPFRRQRHRGSVPGSGQRHYRRLGKGQCLLVYLCKR